MPGISFDVCQTELLLLRGEREGEREGGVLVSNLNLIFYPKQLFLQYVDAWLTVNVLMISATYSILSN